ncbi:hypothetical protein [Winogradskyella wichelsiae]|uniref:hypothetical protein n=1 Tax=Winogradskyella wichelsiae TaxID=2697007 RepID=UPI0015C76427|nr:hypothetical protein [Winogradskyella wichelsiae]
MNTALAPVEQLLIGDFWVLWYAKSNTYSIVNTEFKLLLDEYLVSESKTQFLNSLYFEEDKELQNKIVENLFSYLQNCNSPYSKSTTSTSTDLDKRQRYISKQYNFEHKIVQVNYCSELVLKTIHPSIAHYCNISKSKVDVLFDVYLKENHLHLFKNEELISYVPKKDYHYIQGKFIMQLLCELHNKTEKDWIGSLHGSTITDENNAILFVGKSGKGKSTLCALLANTDLKLLADDVSPLLSKDQHIYYNPSAISIKQGAFKLLEPLVNNFNKLPIVDFNKTKGNLKYLPCTKPKQNHYPCRAIILVNYKPESKTLLEPISIKTILETIIEDSWLSPKPKHAEQFLSWLKNMKLYQLTYSDTTCVTKEVSNLFKEL